MVLRQNVSYDVYGTFCVEPEGQTQLPVMQLRLVWKLYTVRINTSKKIKHFH